MTPLERLGPADVRAVVTTYRDALRTHQEAVNRLNVYPVPDGDTGTNMALTLESVVTEIDAGGEGMAPLCKAIAHGSLMGARGNSGVILCQILRGLSEVWRTCDEIDASQVADALRAASEAAYRAVMRPVEGTILTVAAASAQGACDAAAAGKDLADVLQVARVAAAEALERTPELLSVLKEAGVVDAGGAGYLLLLDAMLNVVTGQPLPEAPETPARAVVADSGGTASARPAAEGGPRFEVMYLLEASDSAVPGLKRAWSDIGDSIVIVGGEGTWNCHIHTDDIGAAVEAALDVGGRPRRIHVTDLDGQVEEERWVRESSEAEPGAAAVAPMTTAVVAVASGAGVARIFRSLGAAAVVAGGQSMNPSTAEILQAVEAVAADQVVVLPNNSNIVPVARQVDALTDKAVHVVPTRAVAEGMAALLEYDADEPAEANAAAMGESATKVTPGEVTQAVRASSSSVGPIAEGAWLGLSADGIEVVADTAVDAATALLAKLLTEEHELVTVLEGEDATPDDSRRIHEWLEHHCPGVAAEIHDGGQPLYPYLFSIE